MRAGHLTFYISLSAVALLALTIGLIAGGSYIAPGPVRLEESTRVEACRANIQSTLKLQSVDLQQLAGIHGLCYAEINEEDTLLEFGIRRLAYLNQQKQLPILMWMVVAITMSGVALSAIQLLAAYQLALSGKATFEQGGQLSIEGKKVSFNSSVTGLVMLLISISFFYLFVTQVYLIKEMPVATATSIAGTPDMKSGWAPQPRPLKPASTEVELGLRPGGVGPAPSSTGRNP